MHLVESIFPPHAFGSRGSGDNSGIQSKGTNLHTGLKVTRKTNGGPLSLYEAVPVEQLWRNNADITYLPVLNRALNALVHKAARISVATVPLLDRFVVEV